MQNRVLRVFAVVVVVLLTRQSIAVTIDFQSGTFLSEIGNSFSDSGVIFRNFELTDGSTGPVFNREPPTAGNNKYAADLSRTLAGPSNPSTNFAVTAVFDKPLQSISASVLAPTNQKVIMTAFDINGNVLATKTSGLSPGANIIFENLSVADRNDIVVVRWELDAATLGTAGIDNLMFTFAPATAPAASHDSIPGVDTVAKNTSLRASSASTGTELQNRSVTGLSRSVSQRAAGRLVDSRVAPTQGMMHDAPVTIGTSAGDGALPIRVWADSSRDETSNDFVTTSFKSDSTSLLLGVDTVVGEQLLVGGTFGYQTTDVVTNFNAGTIDLTSYSASAYAGYLFTDQLSVDALLGYGDFSFDQTRSQFGATISGTQDARAIFTAANLTFYHSFGNLLVDASTGLLYARMRLDAFTESTGLANPSSRVRIGQWKVGANVAYPVADLELFASAFYVYDFDRTEVSVGPTQAVPSDDTSELQLGAGLRYVGFDDVIASLEYRTIQARDDIDSETVSFNLSVEF